MKIQSNNRFNLVTDEGDSLFIAFNESETKKDGIVLYDYDAVRIGKPLEYSKLVSAIVNDRYNYDDMQAIINNHLLDDGDAEHAEQYVQMQQWRSHAKEVAKEACGIEL